MGWAKRVQLPGSRARCLLNWCLRSTMSPGREITDRGLIEVLRYALLTLARAVVPCPRVALSPFIRCGPPKGN